MRQEGISMLSIGVLALQGAFSKHREILDRLGIVNFEVKERKELERADALIIPGGESTTIFYQLKEKGMVEALKAYGESKPVFGTCAGLILMAERVDTPSLSPFGFLPVAIKRNAYGRQVDSFSSCLDSETFPEAKGVFIRAPKLVHVPSCVKVLGTVGGDPVLVSYRHFLGASFHPELSGETRLHAYFIKEIVS